MKPNAQELHLATDELNEAILEYEENLSSLRLGTRAKVQLDPDTRLVFGRDGRDFKLLIYLRDGGSIPLIKASREVRLQAVEKFKELENNLFDSFKIEIARVKNAKRSVLLMAERLDKLRKETK